MRKSIFAAMFLMVVSMQTVLAQRAMKVWHGDKFELYYINDVDSVQFVNLVSDIYLSEETIQMEVGDTKMLTATVYPIDADMRTVTWESSNPSVAFVANNGLVVALTDGTSTITCSATDGSGVKADCQVTVGNVTPDPQPGSDYVLIGGLKWATKNLGATTVAGSYTTCFGDYFAWGETEPRYTSISLSAYGASFTWKSGYENGYSESKWPSYTEETLDAAHDAATAQLGESWRTPTSEDIKALVEACTGSSEGQAPVSLSGAVASGGIYWLSASQAYEPEFTGVAGLLFVDMADISKRVFFPASGNIRGTSFRSGGESARYWLSALYTSPYVSDNDNALAFYFSSTSIDASWIDYRWRGLTIRPVSDDSNP